MILGIDASQANRRIRSGTEWYSFYLLEEFKRLLRDRNDVTVRLYFRTQPRDDIKANLPKNFELRVLRWPFKYFWAQGRLSLEMLFSAPDILFSPAHTIPVIHPKNTFTTLHDIGFEDYPELYDKLSLWYHRFSAKMAVKRAKHIFTISQYSKQRIVDVYSANSDRISVIYLAYDKDKYREHSEEEVAPVLQKYNLRYKNYLLFLGRLEPKKNILRIIKAYDELANHVKKLPELVFAGRKINIEDSEEYLQNRVELKKRIKFLGYIDEGDEPALYSGAEVFVFPTLYEGFGIPILEAQACGAPVVTSDSTSNPEVAGEGAVIVNPKNVNEISESIQRLLEDESVRGKKIQAGLENAKRFAWEKVAKQTLAKMLS